MKHFCRFRQGDVLLVRAEPPADGYGSKLPHLVLAEGEVTGHKHQITRGQAELIIQMLRSGLDELDIEPFIALVQWVLVSFNDYRQCQHQS